jgi:hypothetical protein
VLYFQTPAPQASIPTAPLNLAAAPGNGQNGLAWNPPASNGGATITSYRVFRGTNASNTLIVTSGGCANLGPVTSCTDTGLTNGQSYYYIVSAVNSAGQGPPSNGATATPTAPATIPATPLTPTPGSPSSPGPVMGSTSVTLGWSASSGATSYSIAVRNMNTNALDVDTTTSNTSYTASLGVGTPYRWNVAACNSAGCSVYTAVLYFQTPAPQATLPTAPLNLAAVGGNGQNGLGWNPPASNGGATITSYRVFRGTNASNTLIVTSGGCANLGPVNGCTDTGLTNGQSYYYIVSAVNSVGQGPPSNGATATPMAQVTIPATPANPTPGSTSSPGPVMGSTSVTLSWSASSGATSYSVAARNMNTNGLDLDITTSNTSFTANLGAGTPYRWNVAACNSAGCSAYTTVLYFQTPQQQQTTLPGAPQNLAAFGGNGQNGLGWNPPASNGGSTVTSYRVFRGTNSSNTAIVTSGGCANLGAVGGCTDTGLTNGQQYYYIVSAVNSVGQGPPSNSATATPTAPITTPVTPLNPAPGSLNIPGPLLSSANVTLNWSASSGAASYSVTVRNMNTNALEVAITTAATSFVAGLSPGTPYGWNVAACNGAGCSSFTAVLYFQTPASGTLPSEPQNLAATAGNGQVSLAWNPPTSNGGSTITSYRVFRGTNAANTLIVTSGGCANLGPLTSCTDTGLTNGLSYYYIVSAVNAAGQGPPSNGATVTPTAPITPPATPLNPAPGSPNSPGPMQSNTSVTFSWSASSGATSYSLGVRNMNTNVMDVDTPTTTTSYTATLTAGTPYRWSVAACNTAGCSSYTTVLYFQTPPSTSTLPSAPQNLSALAGSGQVSLTWNPPASNGGATITNYRVFRGSNSSNALIVTNGGCANLGPVISCTDTGLINGQSYYYIVSAVNNAGQGPPSNGVTAMPAGTATEPLAPPTILAPGGSAASGSTIGTTTPQFSWKAVAGSTSYGLYVFRSDGTQVYSNSALSGESFVLPTGVLLSGTAYRWCMTSIATKESTASASLYFSVVLPTGTCQVSCATSVASGAYVGQTVSFSATAIATASCSTQQATLQWDFGDKSTATGPSLTHIYETPGIYTWQLISSIGSQLCQRSGTITVTSPSSSSLSGIVRSNGHPLFGARLTLNTLSQVTDLAGTYVFTNLSPGTYTATVTATGYNTASEDVSIAPSTAAKRDFALIQKTGTISVLPLSSRYPAGVHFVDGQTTNVEFSALADWAGHAPGTLEFVTSKGAHYAVAASNQTPARHSFDMGKDFGVCGGLKVIAHSSDGASSEPRAAQFTVMSPMAVISPTANNVLSFFSHGDSFTYKTTVGSDVRLFDAIISDSAPKDFPLAGAAGLILKVVPTIEGTISSDGTASYDVNFENANNDHLKFSLCGCEGTVTPTFTLDGQFDDNSCTWHRTALLGAHFNLEPPLSASFNGFAPYNAFASAGPKCSYIIRVPAPFPWNLFYVKFSGTLDADLKGGITLYSPVAWQLKGKLEPEIRADAGFGIDAIFSAAVSGVLKGDIELQTETPHVTRADVDGEIHVGIYGWLHLETTVGHCQWSILDKTFRCGLGASPEATTTAVSPQLVPRAYANDAAAYGRWRGASLASQGNGIPVRRATALQTDIFPHSEPAIASAGQNVTASWLYDAPARSAINRTIVVSSDVNGSIWSLPRPIWDDGTADFHPVLAGADDRSVIAAWEDVRKVLPDAASRTDITSNLEISAAVLDPNTHEWFARTRLSDNSYLDRSPQIARSPSSGKAVVAWIANAANDIYGSSLAPNTLMLSVWDGKAFSTPRAVTQLPYAVLTYTLRYDGTNAVIYAVADLDGDRSTDSDREIYRIAVRSGTLATVTRLTNDSVADVSPAAFFNSDGHAILMWLRDSTLVEAVDDDLTSLETIRADMQGLASANYRTILGPNGLRAVVWPDIAASGSAVWAIFRDPTSGLWGTPEALTETSASLHDLAVTFADSPRVLALYDETPAVSVSSLAGIQQATPVAGTDLTFLQYDLQSDVAIEPSSIRMTTNAHDGDPVEMSCIVSNIGGAALVDVEISVEDGDPNGGGHVLGTTTLKGVLGAGSSQLATITWVAHDPLPSTIFIVVDPSNRLRLENRGNNTIERAFALPDLTIGNIRSERLAADTFRIAVRATNVGNADAPATVIEFHRDSISGQVIAVSDVSPLHSGYAEDVSINMPSATAPSSIVAVINPNAAARERDSSNNTAIIPLPVSNGRREAVRH